MLAEHNSASAEAAEFMHFIYTEEIHCRRLVFNFLMEHSTVWNK
jgi:hypothetical protein